MARKILPQGPRMEIRGKGIAFLAADDTEIAALVADSQTGEFRFSDIRGAYASIHAAHKEGILPVEKRMHFDRLIAGRTNVSSPYHHDPFVQQAVADHAHKQQRSYIPDSATTKGLKGGVCQREASLADLAFVS